MSGSKIGGAKAAARNIANDPDFYRKIGKKGAEAYRKRQAEGTAVPRGFAASKELARTAGALGGMKSRRTK